MRVNITSPFLTSLGFAALSCALLFSTATSVSAEDVVVYTALEDDEISVYRKDFEQKHPDITLKIVRDSTGIITARLLAERANPQADVVWGTALTSLLLADAKRMLAPYNPKGIDRVQPNYKDTKHPEAHWVGIKAWMTGFVCNTIELERKHLQLPRSFADLLQPQFKGAIIMPNPASSGTGYLTVNAILQLMGEEKGWQYLDKLNENIAFYTHSGSKPAKMAGTGEFPIGISFDYRGNQQRDSGEPVVVMFPSEGSGWDVEANALIRKPRIKEGAKRFLDWAICDDAMRMYAKVFAITSVKVDVPFPAGYPDPPESQLIKNDFDWASANRDRILAEWSRRYESKGTQ